MITKKTKIIGIIAGLVGFVAIGAGAIAAQAASINSHPNFLGNLSNAIAQKFNLNISDVQQVVDEQIAQEKVQMENQRQQTFANRINQAVADGKLTQEQANKILAEKASVEGKISALKNKTEEERKTAMKQIRDAEKQWAIDNNIPQQYLMFGFRGYGMGMGKGNGEFNDMGHKDFKVGKNLGATQPTVAN